jgi:glycosyltransferase involved in cell wall biosynthesis
MSDRLPISVFIIAKNEADRIDRAIKSVCDWVDEVVVVDSGSTDETVAVAESLGARVLFNEWEGYGQQKIFSEEACANDWILNIDADEEVGAKLRGEIEAVFGAGPPSWSAFKMYWKLVLFDEEEPKSLAPISDFVRLYDRRKAGFRDSTVHDSVVIREGAIGELSHLIYHRTYRSLAHMNEKLERYTTMQAEDMLDRGRRPSRLRTLFEYPFAYLKFYILRRYWIYGLNGIRASHIYARARLMRLTKTHAAFREDET